MTKSLLEELESLPVYGKVAGTLQGRMVLLEDVLEVVYQHEATILGGIDGQLADIEGILRYAGNNPKKGFSEQEKHILGVLAQIRQTTRRVPGPIILLTVPSGIKVRDNPSATPLSEME